MNRITISQLMKSKPENIRRLAKFFKMDDEAEVLELIFRLDLFISWNPKPKPVQRTQEER